MYCNAQDEDIVEDTSLREAGEKAGLEQGELDDLLQLVQTSEIKDKLKKRTQEALDLGVSLQCSFSSC